MSRMATPGDFALELSAKLTDSTSYDLTIATNGTTQVCEARYSRLFFDKTAQEKYQQYFFDVGSISGTNGVQQTWPHFASWISDSFIIGLQKFYFHSGSTPSFMQ